MLQSQKCRFDGVCCDTVNEYSLAYQPRYMLPDVPDAELSGVGE